ncbi:hypothetical protein FOA52_010271 [Chlamydomonas sp. UWO 241]|nr:hypothetical protein FOA52_010271 [Chlamydomonas sp. UWO 241]
MHTRMHHHHHAATTALASTYQECARQADRLNQVRRGGSFTHLFMPHDGRGIEFTHEARKGIPAGVIEEIRRLNTLDDALHTHGLSLLDAHRSAMAAAGKLQELKEDLPPAQKIVYRKPMAYTVPWAWD